MTTIPYQNEIVSAANQNNIPPSILAGVLDQESGFNANARNVNKVNGQPVSVDQGIAQINNKAHPDVSSTQANNPGYAIPYAASLLSNYYQTCGNWTGALEKYNSGKCSGDTGYASSVLSKANQYGFLDSGNTGANGSTGPSWLNPLESGMVKYGLIGIVIVFGFLFIMNGLG